MKIGYEAIKRVERQRERITSNTKISIGMHTNKKDNTVCTIAAISYIRIYSFFIRNPLYKILRLEFFSLFILFRTNIKYFG